MKDRKYDEEFLSTYISSAEPLIPGAPPSDFGAPRAPTEVLDKLVEPPKKLERDLRIGKLDERRYKVELWEVIDHLDLAIESRVLPSDGARRFAADVMQIIRGRIHISVSGDGMLINAITGRQPEQRRRWFWW